MRISDWSSDVCSSDLVVLEGPGGREEAEYDFVYGADGVHSRVRDGLDIAFEGYVHRREWSIADAELDEWPHEPGVAHLFLRDDGEVGFINPIRPRSEERRVGKEGVSTCRYWGQSYQ